MDEKTKEMLRAINRASVAIADAMTDLRKDGKLDSAAMYHFRDLLDEAMQIALDVNIDG